MQLVEVDSVDTQPLQASLARGAEVLRPTVADPLPLAFVRQAALGPDHQIVRIGMKGLGDLLLAA